MSSSLIKIPQSCFLAVNFHSRDRIESIKLGDAKMVDYHDKKRNFQ